MIALLRAFGYVKPLNVRRP